MRTAIAVALLVAASPAQTGVPSPEDLFRHAHYRLAGIMPLENRASAYVLLLGKSAAIPPAERAAWAGEAYELSARLKASLQKSGLQGVALPLIAHVEPDRALALLLAREPLPPDAMNVVNPGVGLSAALVFTAVLARHGNDAIPQLMQAINTLAEKGIYPYDAVTPLMARSTPEQREKLFQAAVVAYVNSRPSISNDSEFFFFLKHSPPVPQNVARAVAAEVVGRLEQFAAAGLNCDSYAEAGMTVLNCTERVLYEAVPGLQRLDAEAAKKFVASHAVLQQAMLSPVKLAMPMANGAPTPNGSEAQMEFDEAITLEKMAAADPQKASSMAESLPDELMRVNNTVLIARDLAAKDPAQAKLLLNRALSEAAKLDNSDGRLATLFGNIATAAANLGDTELLQSAMQSAFASAHALALSMKDAPPQRRQLRASNCYGLYWIVRLGATAAPQLTLQLIPSLAGNEGEAYLLMNFAQVLAQAKPAVTAERLGHSAR